MSLPILGIAIAIAVIDTLAVTWLVQLVRTHGRACDAQVIARLGALEVTVAHSRAGAVREVLVVTLCGVLYVSLAFLMGLVQATFGGLS